MIERFGDSQDEDSSCALEEIKSERERIGCVSPTKDH